MILSIVIPVYNEGPHIENNLREILSHLTDIPDLSPEFVLVDDGSQDDTSAAIFRAARFLPACHLLRFSRNFGKEAAVCAGLEAASGDACVVMDSDLQHPPALIPEMVRLWREGYEVVEAVKERRGRESLAYKLFAKLFYRSFDRFSGLELEGASDFKLMDRKVVEAWRTMSEHATFFRGMSSWVGFRRASLTFSVPERAGGESKWGFRKLAGLAIDALTSFSAMPLQIVTVAGVIFFLGAVILGIETLVMKLAGHAFTGFTTVILLLLIIGSLLMLSLGVIGTYIAKIYDEVKSRPRYIIAEDVRREKEQ